MKARINVRNNIIIIVYCADTRWQLWFAFLTLLAVSDEVCVLVAIVARKPAIKVLCVICRIIIY